MRVKTGTVRRKKHKKVLKQAKGFRGARRRTVKGAKEGVLHALSHAYIGRKNKKRNFRTLWIQRLNAALREQGLSYSQFMHILKKENIVINRKMLSEIAVTDPDTFERIVNQVTKET